MEMTEEGKGKVKAREETCKLDSIASKAEWVPM
jgi:hypothetical protein